MLNRFSTVLQSAADALAPPAPPLEDLKYHWKLVMRFYSQRSVHSKTPVEETNIPAHLEQLLKILMVEDASVRKEGSSVPCTVAGPCLEFLLQHRLLDLLATLACADSPPGMKRYLLGYLRRFVSALSPHLLTHASIHLPLVRIVNVCSRSKASPTEAEEIDFLLTLCQLVHNHPYLTLIFNKEVKTDPPASKSSSASGSSPTLNNCQELCTPLANMELGTPKSKKQIASSRTESSCGDSKTQADGEINSIADDAKILNKPENCCSSFLPVDQQNLPSQNEERVKTPTKFTSDSDVQLAEGSIFCLNDTLPNETSTKELSGDCDHQSERGNEELGDHKWPLSQTMTRTGTPESLAFPDGEDYQGIEGEDCLPLLDAVLGYINSVDSLTKLRVCEGLLLLVSVADDTFSSAIARTSRLGLIMAEKLSSSLQEISSDVHPDYLEDIPSNWGPETSQLWLEQHTFPGSRLVASFVSWLNFCDQLTLECPPEVADSIANAIRALFFEVELESELCSQQENTRKQLITNIISLCLRHLSSPALLTELNYWLVGESRELETPMKKLLLANCLDDDDNLSLSTLRLFELLLENCDEHVINCLVLVHLASRAYYDPSPARGNAHMESWSDEEDAREQERERARESRERKMDVCSESSTDGSSLSRTLAPCNIHKIIDSFLLLLPSSLRSAIDYEQAGYHQYVAEAQRQYLLNWEHCAQFGWPTEAAFPDDTGNSSDSRPEADHCFSEGPFLSMIFTRLSTLFTQPYEVNLQLTALVSRLAMLPHPHLHEYLLNPLLPLAPGTKSLFSTLRELAEHLQVSLSSLPNCKKMLVRTRQHLLGDVTQYDDQLAESSRRLESVIVLEEFCKELAAIAFVKYHHSS